MAGEISRSYHDELRAEERQRVALRIANGTKASSPQIISHRRQNPEYTGSGGDAVGSFNRPFFANKDESDKQLSGGVLRHFDYAQRILKQRARDDLARTAEKEGVPSALAGIQGEPPTLSERESRELELNQLLSALQDEIESGNVGSIAFTEVRQIPRLLISLTPGFTAQELTRLSRFISDMTADVEVEEARAQNELPLPAVIAAAPPGALPAGQSARAIAEATLAADEQRRAAAASSQVQQRTNIKRINAFLKNVLDYINIALGDVGSDPQTRVARAKAVAKVLFDPKKVFVRQAGVVAARVPTFNVRTVPSTIAAPMTTVRNVRTIASNIVDGADNISLNRILNGYKIPHLGRPAQPATPTRAAITERPALTQEQKITAIKNIIKKEPIRELRRVFNIIDE